MRTGRSVIVVCVMHGMKGEQERERGIMTRRAYKAKTLSGAQSMVRRLLNQREELSEIIGKLLKERRELAKLAAEGPAFTNPLHVFEVQALRDRILREECKLKPNGEPL